MVETFLRDMAVKRILLCFTEVTDYKFLQVACWTIGEFGDLLLQSAESFDLGDEVKDFQAVRESDVIGFFEQWLLFNIQLNVATRYGGSSISDQKKDADIVKE